jgi:hypothetical protein
LDKGALLEEYFSIGVAVSGGPDGDVRLTSLPRLLDGHTPCMAALPAFLLALARDVNWTEEQPCFDGIARALAGFYAQLPVEEGPAGALVGAPADGVAPTGPSLRSRVVSTVLSPGFRAHLVPSCALVEAKQIIQVCGGSCCCCCCCRCRPKWWLVVATDVRPRVLPGRRSCLSKGV